MDGGCPTHDLIIDRLTSPCAAAEQLRIEQAIFEDLAQAQAPRRLRLWRPLPALIATLGEANQPHFAQAAARAAGRGLAVWVRPSGGGAVCLGPGSLVVSHFYRSPRNDIDSSYRQFAALLTEAVAALDVTLREEHVLGAYCDGRFDLAWQGRKVGGIAQRRRFRDGVAHVWIHAVLAVEATALRYPEAVSEFYADLGATRLADPRRTTTLSHCLADATGACDLMSRLSDAIVRVFTSNPPNPPRFAA
jgi:lipoate-protein ligase A